MLIAEIVVVALTALGMAGALLKTIHDHGQKSGELSSALTANTKATEHLTTVQEKLADQVSDHEVRIVRLENK